MKYHLKEKLTEDESIFCDAVADLVSGEKKSVTLQCQSWSDMKRLECMARAVADRCLGELSIKKNKKNFVLRIFKKEVKNFVLQTETVDTER